jgi:hypothetical protein
LALCANTSGNNNIAIGCLSLVANTTGSSNIALGLCSGCLLTTGANNTIIGSLPGTADLVCTLLLGAGTCERLKIDNNGLCTNGTSGLQTPSLGVGTAPSGTVGEIRATNNITAYYTSDRKFKENIKPIENALEKVQGIGGKTYDWTDEYVKDHGGEDGYFVQKSDFGVIAQDVQSMFPLAVRVKSDGTLAVDYEKLVALSFAAIVELKKEIDELKGKNVK